MNPYEPPGNRRSGPLQCFACATQGHWVRAQDQAGFKSLPDPFVDPIRAGVFILTSIK